MSSQAIEKFRQYLDNQKDDFLQDGRRVEGIIRDIFPEDKSLIVLLTSAWKAGVATELRQTANLEVTIAQCGDRLCQEYSLRESSALSAVRMWAYALGTTDVVPVINVSSTSSFRSLPVSATETKKCPFCAEEVKKDARKCRYCHSDISDDAIVKRTSVNERQADELMRQQEALAREKQKLERERQEIEKMKALQAERQKLEAERSELTDKKMQFPTGQCPPISPAGLANNRRYIAYDNETVVDTQTNMIWAAKDNGTDINWQNAKSYCENYRGGGYTDWRMPTQTELAGLYDADIRYELDGGVDVHITQAIRLTGVCTWASENDLSRAAGYNYNEGERLWFLQSFDFKFRVLPLRSYKSTPTSSVVIEAVRNKIEAHAKEIKKDGRFVAYDNGTVLDTMTNLMWAAKDSGNRSGLNWQDAKNYCENYRGGGYTNWRMPKKTSELAGLYDETKSYNSDRRLLGFIASDSSIVHLTGLISLSSTCIWTAETCNSDAAIFNFNIGKSAFRHQSGGRSFSNALAVREVK